MGKRQRRRKTAHRRRRIIRTQSGDPLHSQSRRRGRKRRHQTIRELTRAEDIVIAGEIGFQRREFRLRADRGAREHDAIVHGGLIDLVQRKRGPRCRALRVQRLWIDLDPARGNLFGQGRLQAVGRNLRRPFEQGDVGFRRRSGRILERRDSWLMPSEGYLGRDGIKCLRGRGGVRLGMNAGTGGAGSEPERYRSPCKD